MIERESEAIKAKTSHPGKELQKITRTNKEKSNRSRILKRLFLPD